MGMNDQEIVALSGELSSVTCSTWLLHVLHSKRIPGPGRLWCRIILLAALGILVPSLP